MGGRTSYLGEFEQVVLLAVARLGADASGARLRSEITERTGRAVSIGALYATLDRLVTKAYLRAREDSSSGRPRRLFALTPSGIHALETSREIQQRMWSGVKFRDAGRRS